MVIAQGTSDSTKDLYGRNDGIFLIDFECYYVEKNIVYRALGDNYI